MEVSGTNKDVTEGGDPVAMLASKRAALPCSATQWKHFHSGLLGTSVQCYCSLATTEVCRTEMNVTASPCFPLLWFCLSKLPFCTRESNEGGTQASLFLNTGSVTVLQCYTQGSLFLNTAALLFTSEAHFPLWDETGDSPKLRIWEQLAGATPPYLPTHPHTPNRFAPIWVTDNK